MGHVARPRLADAFDGSVLEVEESGGLFLLSPRPPGLLVLNEPETSLHPQLTGALARLISAAAARTQIVVVTHSAALVDALEEASPRPCGTSSSTSWGRPVSLTRGC